MQAESGLMKFFKKINLEPVAWSLRRLHVPVKSNDLVLEVGSGGNPYARSNVLVDAYYETRERHFAPLISDRPTVLALAENLPFKDQSFDFVIASHVLEHSHNPDKFLTELMRVAKAGYIEVPDAFMERLIPYLDHRLEITDINNQLIIKKKHQRIIDPELYSLFNNKVSSFFSKSLISKRPFAFHVRFYWKKNINYKITNPEVDTNWPEEVQPKRTLSPSTVNQIKGTLLRLFRVLFSQNVRNQKIDIDNLLICPKCHGTLFYTNKIPSCSNCHATYKNTAGLYNFC